MNPWRRVSCHIAPILVAGAIGLFGIMLLDRGPITVMTHYHIVPAVVYPGQRAELDYTLRDMRLGCNGTVRRWIVDSNGVVHYLTNEEPSRPQDSIKRPDGTRDVTKEVPIPFGIAANKAVFHAEVTRWCNIVQEIFWPMVEEHTAEFNVSRTPGEPGYPTPPASTVPQPNPSPAFGIAPAPPSRL